MLKVTGIQGSIYERHLAESARAKAEELKALADYNIMMGNLDDPSEDEGEGEEGEDDD